MRLPGILAAAFTILAIPAAAQAGDAAAGQAVFKSVCGGCHSPVAGKTFTGPSLFGIVGRKSGSVAGFKYSPANLAASLTWDVATLDSYLKAPKEKVPGTTMTYAGLKDDTKRADLIAYLETLR
jgi:cytochrome c